MEAPQVLVDITGWRGAPEIETQADKESRMNYSHGGGDTDGSREYVGKSFGFCTTDTAEHGQCLD